MNCSSGYETTSTSGVPVRIRVLCTVNHFGLVPLHSTRMVLRVISSGLCPFKTYLFPSRDEAADILKSMTRFRSVEYPSLLADDCVQISGPGK